MLLNGADMLVRSLKEQGVDVVFGYPGGSVLDIYHSLHLQQLRHIVCAHEQGAAHGADGYARTSGKTGVVVATSGPGATNLVTGLATAYLDSVPMVAITGNVSRTLQGRDSFQEVDITGVTIPVTKHNFLVEAPQDIPSIVARAFTVANSQRPGPVLVDIPKDVAVGMGIYKPAGRYVKRKLPEPCKGSLERAVHAAVNKTKPVVLVGGGVKAARAGQLAIELAEKLDGFIVSTTMGLSAVSSGTPNYLGMVGMHGNLAANYALDSADIIYCVGTRFSDRVIGDKERFAPNAHLVHIELDSSEINKNLKVDSHICADCSQVLPLLTAKIKQKDNPLWHKEIESYIKSNSLPHQQPSYGIDPRKAISLVAELTKGDTFVVTDVGQHQMLVAQCFPFEKENSFASSLGLGTMGYGMGAANGVQVAHPDETTVLFTGDGSFHMNFQELAVAVSENLPVIVLVFNNQVLGMVYQWQNRFYCESAVTGQYKRKTDIPALAKAMGASSGRAENEAQLKSLLKQAIRNRKGPTVIECIVDSDYEVYPFIPAGKSFSEAIKEKDYKEGNVS